MVSKEVKETGKVAEVITLKEYEKLEGLLKECLPSHVPIEIQRKKGKIELWSKYPKIMKSALESSIKSTEQQP